MATGFFNGYIDGLMKTPSSSPGLNTDYIAAALYDSANPPSASNLEDETVITYANLNTAAGGEIEDTADHFAQLASITFSSVAKYVMDAADTVLATITGTGSKDVLLVKSANSGTSIATSDNVIAYYDLTSPVTPNGQAVTITWSASGIFKLGGRV